MAFRLTAVDIAAVGRCSRYLGDLCQDAAKVGLCIRWVWCIHPRFFLLRRVHVVVLPNLHTQSWRCRDLLPGVYPPIPPLEYGQWG